MSWFYCALVLALVGLCFADLSSEFDHFVALDPAQKMKLYWTVNQGGGGGDDEGISFAVEAATTGWVGLGFSSGTGRMKGADIVIGWVQADGTAHLTDRYGEGYFVPQMDDSQDYKLISGTEKDGKTTLRFSRKLDTCDENDYKIEEGTTKVIFAYNDEDPTSDNDMKEHSYRGSRSLLLLNFGKKDVPDPSWKKLEFLMNNTSVPDIHTSYTCKPFKLPDLGGKQHIVRFEPVVQPGNEGFVHHFVVNECKGKFPDHLLNFTGNCADFANMPAEVLHCKAGEVIAAWGVGGGPFVYPKHVGYPIGMNDSAMVVIVEIHYDNPELIKGRFDSSGVRFYYTPDLRTYDAGTLTVGVGVSTWMAIPPNQDNWITTGYCRKECTKKALQSSKLPNKGIKIFASFLHTHLAGRGTWTQHIRDGVQLPDIARDNYYDFNFQEMQVLRKEVHFKPGDEIIHVCKYNTKDRKKATFGGLSTYDEMCLNFLTYYPRLEPLGLGCTSKDMPATYKFLKKYFPFYAAYSHRYYNPLLAAKPNWTDEMVKDFRHFLDNEELISDCSNKGNKSVFAEQVNPINLREKIKINQPYFPPPSPCAVSGSTNLFSVDVAYLLLSIWTVGTAVLSL